MERVIKLVAVAEPERTQIRREIEEAAGRGEPLTIARLGVEEGPWRLDRAVEWNDGLSIAACRQKLAEGT